ncbi:MAG TPA: nitroreductase/quinone reductase family protein [Acidimicrobiia bacterium]|nr:nitroreductase/quinone reductase family protein [Acidimicrobiia bacterium]
MNVPAVDKAKAKDVFARAVTALHTQIYKRTGGRVGGKAGKTTMGLLTTTGRKSGQSRTTPLNIMADGDRWLLVASYGGDDRDPQWFKNLQSNPEATIQLGAETIAVRATVAGIEEKKALWPKVVASYKGYDGYQRKTSRDIPVVILTRS